MRPTLTAAQVRAFHRFTFGSLWITVISRRTLNVFRDAGLIHRVRPEPHIVLCWELTDTGRAWLAANPEPACAKGRP